MQKIVLIEETLTRSVIGAFYTVYNVLQFGYFESVYANALEYELRLRGHTVAREVSVPIFYKGILVGNQRIDMIVDDRLVVENKSTKDLPESAHRQTRSYLVATAFRVGLLLHFGLKPKFYRFVATHDEMHHDPQ